MNTLMKSFSPNEHFPPTEEVVLLDLTALAIHKGTQKPSLRHSTEAANYILDNWADNQAVVANFGGFEEFYKTIEKIDVLDAVFRSTRGSYFHLEATPAETARNFAESQLKYWRTGIRPSLPGQVIHYLDLIAFSKKDPYYKAAVLVAARAELEPMSRPEYHNACHSSDVIATTMEFLKKNNMVQVRGVQGAVKLTRQELAIGITAAAGHDVGHPGGKNAFPGETIASDPLRLERRSVSIITPLLRVAGIAAGCIEKIKVPILATSPDRNGPRKMIREIDRLHDSGQAIEWERLAEHERFPELRLLAEDPAVRVIAQNLMCADLAQSCLFGLRSNLIATEALQVEWRNRGYSDRLVGDATDANGSTIEGGQTVQARKEFLDFGAYGAAGPLAAGAKAAVGQNYTDLYGDTEARFQVVKARLERPL